MAIGRIPEPGTGIPESIIAAKGDILVGTANDTPAVLSVGTDTYTLVADSAEATGLKWAAPSSGAESLGFTAGKNRIINGDFFVNQRAFSSTTTSDTYGFDRWYTTNSDGTVTSSAQTFTAGTAPVAGYEGANYLRQVTTGQTAASASARIVQGIENVRTLAGQTATLSFWAKAASGTPNIAIELTQAFGSGGSPSSDVNTYAGQVTLSTSWTRVSVTVAIPSLSGKTVGTTANTSQLLLRMWTSAGTNFNARTGSLGIQSNTFEIWGVQLEAGSTATAFQTATGTIQGELAACNRYYYRQKGDSNTTYYHFGYGQNANNTTQSAFNVQFPVEMRATPTLEHNYPTITYTAVSNGTGFNSSAAPVYELGSFNSPQSVVVRFTSTGQTALLPAQFYISNNANGYLAYSSEL